MCVRTLGVAGFAQWAGGLLVVVQHEMDQRVLPGAPGAAADGDQLGCAGLPPRARTSAAHGANRDRIVGGSGPASHLFRDVFRDTVAGSPSRASGPTVRLGR